MGYNTNFEGVICINPPLDHGQVTRINEFCAERHGGNVHPHPGFPGFWCCYVVSEDGKGIGWDGTEKSYDMEDWLPILIEQFFAPWGCTLYGELWAQGERRDDRWILRVRNNIVVKIPARVVFVPKDRTEPFFLD